MLKVTPAQTQMQQRASMLPRWKLFGDPAGTVDRSSTPSTRTNRAENRAGERFSSEPFVCLSTIDDVRSSFEWLSWLLAHRCDRRQGVGIWLGSSTWPDSRSPILLISCPFCPSHQILTQAEYHRPRLDASIVPFVPVAPFPLLAEATCQIPAPAFPGKCPRAVASHRLKAEAWKEGRRNERTNALHCIAAASAVPEREGLGRLGGCIVTSAGGVAWRTSKRVKPGKGRDVVELGRPVNGARVVI